jgi:hypothetical protein
MGQPIVCRLPAASDKVAIESPVMALTSRFARRFRLLSVLRASLIAGAAYDLFFALAMAAFPELPARILKLPLPPLPDGAFYLWIMAVLLTMLAALYLAAAHDPRRYSAIVAVAVAGRLAGALALAATGAGSDLPGLYPLAAADFVFGAVHAASWFPIRS